MALGRVTQTFLCWIPNWNESSPSEVMAFDSEEAAIKFAEDCHDGQGEYPSDTIVNVMDEDGEKTRFNVTWEAVRNYYAEPLDLEK